MINRNAHFNLKITENLRRVCRGFID